MLSAPRRLTNSIELHLNGKQLVIKTINESLVENDVNYEELRM